MENEVMNEEMIVEIEPEIVEEKKDNSGAIGFAIGSLLTLGAIAAVKGGKKLISKVKAKRNSKILDVEEETEEDGSESDE